MLTCNIRISIRSIRSFNLFWTAIEYPSQIRNYRILEH